MNQFDNNGGSGASKSTSSMRRLLTDGSGTNPVPSPTPPPSRSNWRNLNVPQYLIPAILVLVLLIGVAIMAYSFGVSHGKSSANAERDHFIEQRQQSWAATATAAAANPLPTPSQTEGSANKGSGYLLGSASYARVDKIEGDKLTILLLDESGRPNGTTLVVNRTKQTQVWRVVPNQPAELRPGDSVLFVADRNNDSFDARSIQILPTNS